MNIPLIMDFLRELQLNNSKAWMDAHRTDYMVAKHHFTELVQHLTDLLQATDPGLHGLEATTCIFRINKNDFSKKGEPPYKGHFGAGISPGGRHSPYPNYVLVLEPGGKSRVGGGIRKPTPKQLELIREEIDYNPGELQTILKSPCFYSTFGNLQGGQRSTMPKGYHKNHPEANLLRCNSFQVLRYFADEEVLQPDFINQLLPYYELVKPLHDFLNKSLTGQ